MSELRQYITARVSALRAKMSPLREHQAQLKKDLLAIERELEAYDSELEEAERAAEAIGLNSTDDEIEEKLLPESVSLEGKNQITIKQAIRIALSLNPKGLNSNDIFSNINSNHFGNELDRTSFSPQLSRMKKQGEVDQEGGIYTITNRGRAIGHLPRVRERPGRHTRENGAPGGATPSAPDAKPAEGSRSLLDTFD